MNALKQDSEMALNQSILEPMPQGQAPSLQELEQLIQKFAPIICFHQEEERLPVNVEWYLQKCWLVNSQAKTREPATAGALAQAPPTGAYHLELKEGISLAWEKVPAKVYVQVKAQGAYTDLQYWLLYAQTGSAMAHVKWLIDGTIKGHEGKISLDPLGKLNGYWENVTLRVNNATRQAEQVFLQDHWLPVQLLQQRGSQVLVYAAKNNYAFYSSPGLYDAQKTRFDLYSSQLEFYMRHEVGNGRELNCSTCCELISAPYLGSQQPQAPPWFNFTHHWGQPQPDYLTVSSVKRTVLATFGKSLEFLLSGDILGQLVNYLLQHFAQAEQQQRLRREF